jgi:hypothetical protein
MTTTEATLYPILDLDGNACLASRDEIEDLIANVEASKMVQAALDDDVVLMNAYIRGRAADGTTFKSIREQSDYALLKLWHEELREQAIELKASSMGLRWDIELQGDPKPKKTFAWDVEPIVEIEGQTDDEMIKIGRHALIQRLMAYDVAGNRHPIDIKDEDDRFIHALEHGLKGYESYSVDDLKKEWEDSRVGFYHHQGEGTLHLGVLGEEDPEFDIWVDE